MAAILEQLGLDQTFFIEFIAFAVLFLILANVYFKPFLKLFQARHKRTIEDRETAERLVRQAEEKFQEYQDQIQRVRADARKDYEAILMETKKEETAILADARNQAKKITQEALDSATQQADQLRKQLNNEVEALAVTISDKLLKRQG